MASRRHDNPIRLGFTMTELLVVMGIMIILVGVLIVAVSGVRDTARGAATRSLMTAMSQATSRFKEDMGYLPPVLDNDRTLVDPVPMTETLRGADGRPNYLNDLQGWYSYTSPAEYLLGYGSFNEDGGGRPDRDSIPNGMGNSMDYPGIGHPGGDGVWGATQNADGLVDCGGATLGNRRPLSSGIGRIFGPYLELKDDSTIGSLAWDADNNAWDSGSIDPETGQPAVFFPGDHGYHSNAPKVLVDAWGSPIRYYRRPYPAGSPSADYPSNYQVFPRASEWRHTPRLSEFIALRPWEIDPGYAVDHIFSPPSGGRWGDFNSASDGGSLHGDTTTTAGLQSGEWAFLSAGPNRRINNWHRIDHPDVGGNDGDTFLDWLGHFPDRAMDDSWYALQPVGAHCRAEGWYPAPVTEEANKDNISEIGP